MKTGESISFRLPKCSNLCCKNQWIVLRPKLLVEKEDKRVPIDDPKYGVTLCHFIGAKALAIVRDSVSICLHDDENLEIAVAFDLASHNYVIDGFVTAPIVIEKYERALRTNYGDGAADSWMEGDILLVRHRELVFEFVSVELPSTKDQIYDVAAKRFVPEEVPRERIEHETNYVSDELAARVLGSSPKKTAVHAMNSLIATIVADTRDGVVTTVPGFATFSRQLRRERLHRNPKTGDVQQIQHRYKVRVDVEEAFKRAVE